MKPVINLYSPTILINLAYMMQASEYDWRNFWRWFWSADDLGKVRYRRDLDYTAKAKLVLVLAASIYLAIILTAIRLISGHQPAGRFVGAGLLLALPTLLAASLMLAVKVIEVLVQRPYLRIILRRAAVKYAAFNGTKLVVLGSYGKTTTKSLLAHVLSRKKKLAATTGNLNTPIALARFILKQVPPEAELLIIELGEYRPGDILKFAELVKPDIAVITGLSEVHLDTLGSLDQAAANLLSVRSFVVPENLFVNNHSPKLRRYAKGIKAERYDDKRVLGWRISGIRSNLEGLRFNMSKGKKKLELSSPLLGRHNVPTIALAAALGDEAGLSHKELKAAIADFKPVEHRFELKRLGGAYLIDDTYNGNIDGFLAGISFVKSLRKRFNRKIYVTPGLVESGAEKARLHQEVAQAAAPVFDMIVLVKNSNAPELEKGLEQAKFKGELKVIDDPLKFYRSLDSFVADGDLVLMQNDLTDNYL